MARFNLEIGIDSSGARRGASEVNQSLRSIRGSADPADRNLQRVERRVLALGSAASAAGNLLQGLLAGLAFQQFTQLSDSFTRLENQIRLTTESADEYAVIQAEIIRVARDTNAPLDETISLYSRLARAGDDLGATQGEIIQFTEGVGNALRVSGTDAQAAQGALLQLSQALSNGVVRAEEFNSVLEGAPIILSTVADNLGITTGQLRQLVVDGELTSRQFFEAFNQGAADLAEQAAQTEQTFSEAFTGLGNALTVTIGRFNEASGAAGGLTGVIGELSDFVATDLLRVLIQGDQFVEVLIQDFRILFDTIGDAGRQLAEFLGLGDDELNRFGAQVLDNLANPFTTVRTFIQILATEIISLVDRAINAFGALGRAVNRLFSGEFETLGDFLGQTLTSLAETDAEVLTRRSAAIEDLLRQNERLVDETRATFEDVARTPPAEIRDRVLSTAAGGLSPIEGGDVAGTSDPADRIKELRDEYAELIALVDEGRRVFDATRTPAEEYEETLRRLTILFNAGAINADTLARAVDAAAETLREANAEEIGEQFEFLRDIGRAAAEDIQGAFTDLFLSAGQGLDDFADQFGATLQRISANLLANQALRFLTQGLAGLGGGSGPLAAFVEGFAGAFADGGRIPAGQFGIAGERGPEFVQGPATVTSTASTAAMLAPQISIVNVTNPRAAIDALDTNAGAQGIVNQVSLNREAIRRELGLS